MLTLCTHTHHEGRVSSAEHRKVKMKSDCNPPIKHTGGDYYYFSTANTPIEDLINNHQEEF